MGIKRKKVAGKWVYLPTGVQYSQKKNLYIVTLMDGGKRKERYFPATDAGLNDAKALADSIRKEKKTYGQKFGALTDSEKRAVDLWRAYRDKCQREASVFCSIEEVMKKGLEQVIPESITPLFSELANDYLRMLERKQTSPEHLRKRADKVRRFSAYFQGVRAGNITPAAVQAFIDTISGRNGGEPAPRTVQDYMVCLNHIFRYGVKRGMVKKNPLEAMDKPQVKPSGEPETITPGETKTLFTFACHSEKCRPYLPALLLAAFCGIRPAEIARMRYKDLFPGGRPQVYLSRTITKTSIDRIAKIRPNLAAWLSYTEQQGLHGFSDAFILPGENEKKRTEGYTRNLERLAKGANVTIPRDALRHTAATMICTLDGMEDAATEMGNDIKTLQRHYRRAVTKEEAQEFFSIMPPP